MLRYPHERSLLNVWCKGLLRKQVWKPNIPGMQYGFVQAKVASTYPSGDGRMEGGREGFNLYHFAALQVLNSIGALTGVSAAGGDDVVGGWGGAGVLRGIPRPDEGLHASGRGLLQEAQQLGAGGKDGGAPRAGQGGGHHHGATLGGPRGRRGRAGGGDAPGRNPGLGDGGDALGGGLRPLVGLGRRADAVAAPRQPLGCSRANASLLGGGEEGEGRERCVAAATDWPCTASIISRDRRILSDIIFSPLCAMNMITHTHDHEFSTNLTTLAIGYTTDHSRQLLRGDQPDQQLIDRSPLPSSKSDILPSPYLQDSYRS